MWAGIHFFRCAALSAGCLVLAAGAFAAYYLPAGPTRFVVLGDRTGETVPGVYQQVLRDAAADRPDFVINVGDSIQGGSEATLDQEWREFLSLLRPYRRLAFFYTPGNHDVWSAGSAAAYARYTRHPLHYSFDYGAIHFTVLDDSRSDQLAAGELAFLEQDLQLHRDRPVKLVLSHRPSWLLQAVLGNPKFPLNQIATRYGVSCVIAGHLHQMLHADLGPVTYLSVASSGGHLRASRKYEDGWFFAHSLVTVEGVSVRFEIRETGAPFGQGRISHPADWGVAGSAHRKSSSS